jgi:hypothetical protein
VAAPRCKRKFDDDLADAVRHGRENGGFLLAGFIAR